MTSSKLYLYGHRVRRHILQPGRVSARTRVIPVAVRYYVAELARAETPIAVQHRSEGGLMHGLLKFFGKLGKGKATITGIVAVVAGAVLGTDQAAQSAWAVSDTVVNFLTSGGALLGAFGVGRKVMDHAKEG